MVEVHCKGCGRMIGYALNGLTIYCTEPCAEDYPAAATEGRDSLIEVMNQQGYKSGALGKLFGITRQRVDQIIRERQYA